MKHLFFLLLLIVSYNTNLYSQKDSVPRFKRAGYTLYTPDSHIYLINDSLQFKGYLIFEASKNITDKFYMYDHTYYQFEMFWVTDLSDIFDLKKRNYYNPIFLDYPYADELGGFETVDGRIKIDEENFAEFIKVKKLYLKYREREPGKKTKIFYPTGLKRIFLIILM
jgi:hypothetical protein